MPIVTLLPAQVQEISNRIAGAGFASADFTLDYTGGDWAGYPGHEVPVVRHTDSESYFAMSLDPDEVDQYAYGPQDRSRRWRVIYSPGADTWSAKDDSLRWPGVLALIEQWLTNVRGNYGVPSRPAPAREQEVTGWPKKYKNAFAEAIIAAGLSQDQFSTSIEIDNGLSAFVIVLKDTPLKFVARCSVDVQFDVHYTRFAPGLPETGYIPESGFFDLRGALANFERWLSRDVREMLEEKLTPDLWDQAVSSFTGLAYVPDDRQNKFNDVERNAIIGALNRFEAALVVQFDPSPTELASIKEDIHYLRAATERLNKFDWKGTAINTIIAIGIALNLDPEKGKVLFALFRGALEGALHLLK